MGKFAFSDHRGNGSRDFGEFPLLERNCHNVRNRTCDRKGTLKNSVLITSKDEHVTSKMNSNNPSLSKLPSIIETLTYYHGRPQTFFQGRAKIFQGGQEPTFCLKNIEKDTIFPQKV